MKFKVKKMSENNKQTTKATTKATLTMLRYYERHMPRRNLTAFELNMLDDGNDQKGDQKNFSDYLKKQLFAVYDRQRSLQYASLRPFHKNSESSEAPSIVPKQQYKRAEKMPTAVLDAPVDDRILNDYYSGAMDVCSVGAKNTRILLSLGNEIYMQELNDQWKEAATGPAVLVYANHRKLYHTARFSPSNRISMCSNKDILIFDANGERCMRVFYVNNSYFHESDVPKAFEWISDSVIAHSQRGNNIIFRDMRQKSDRGMPNISFHQTKVVALKVHPERKTVVVSSDNDNSVCIWDIRKVRYQPYNPNGMCTGKVSRPLQELKHDAAVKAIDFSGRTLLTGAGLADKHLYLWNMDTGARKGKTNTHEQITSCFFSPDKREIVTTHGSMVSNYVKLWSRSHGKIESQGNYSFQHQGRDITARLSKDRSALFVLSNFNHGNIFIYPNIFSRKKAETKTFQWEMTIR